MNATEEILYTFDGPYADCYRCPSNCIDKRHAYLLHDILRSGMFCRALEIGCADGASSTAFIEAVNRTTLLRVTLCDVQLTNSLVSVAMNADDTERVIVANKPSTEVLADPQQHGGPFDFVFVDGNHDFASVKAEYDLLRVAKPLAICAHDTSATLAGYPKAEGAEYLKRAIALEWGWLTLEDNIRRPDEATERGFFFATPNTEIYRRVKSMFYHWCWEGESNG